MTENEMPAAAFPGLYSERPPVSTMTVDAAKAEYAELAKAQQAPHRLERLEKLSERIHGVQGQQGGAGDQGAYNQAANRPVPPLASRTAAEGRMSELEQLSAAASEVGLDEAAFAESERQFDQVSMPRSALDFASALPGEGEAAQLRTLLHKEGVSPQVANLVNSMPSHFSQMRVADQATFDGAIDQARDAVMKQPGGARVVEQAVQMLRQMEAGNHPLFDQAELLATVPQGIAELARLWRVRQRAA
jgi:hypothetical protein